MVKTRTVEIVSTFKCIATDLLFLYIDIYTGIIMIMERLRNFQNKEIYFHAGSSILLCYVLFTIT